MYYFHIRIADFEVRYALGCTSGHGVCGISRGFARAIVTTLIFMLTGFMTVYLMLHVFAL